MEKQDTCLWMTCMQDATKLTDLSVVNSKTGDFIIKIFNGTDETKEINILLAGLSSDVSIKAAKMVLAGSDADAVNEDRKSPAVKPEYSIENVIPVLPVLQQLIHKWFFASFVGIKYESV